MTQPGWDWRGAYDPVMDAAWKTVAWWHDNRPKWRMVEVRIRGGWAWMLTPMDPAWTPEHVKEARQLLGLPGNHRE